MKNGKKNVASCLICEQEMVSDILAKNYCKLCGMIIENNESKFCCDDCENKFNKINITELKDKL
ncbi:MAG: hypothetical protein AABX17_03945 [Nanoarchaeota archaeon]